MKKALLVGNNYPGTKAELKGCINDVWIMREILTSVKGFDESDITILIDTDDSYMQPTGENIRNEFSKLCENAEPGDYIMFHFSGHGTQVPCFSEDDHKNECLVPTDMNLISDDDLREIADKCKPGVNLTFVSDCCHSGGMLDHAEVLIEGDKTKDPDSAPPEFQSRELPIENVAQMLSQMLGKHISPSGVRGALSEKYGAAASKYAANMYKNFTGNALSKDQAKQLTGFMTGMFKKLGVDGDAQGAPAHTSSSGSEKVAATRPTVSEDIGVLITGCQGHETSADVRSDGTAYGALTKNIQKALEQNPGANYYEIVLLAREGLAEGGFTQNPCLECSEANSRLPFICPSV